MRVSRQQTVVACAVCDRTLLLGETVTRFAEGGQVRQVCALCRDDAAARGWLREGAPQPPPVSARPRRPSLRDRLFPRPAAEAEASRVAVERVAMSAVRSAPTTTVPATERPRPSERRREVRVEQRTEAAVNAIRDGIQAFNGSAYRRTVSSITKSLGKPRVSVVPLGGIRPDVVVTVVWDLSWYQYRVDPTITPAVRLEGRGDDARDLEARWRSWNAATGEDGSVVLT
jgi:hypothetical protein